MCVLLVPAAVAAAYGYCCVADLRRGSGCWRTADGVVSAGAVVAGSLSPPMKFCFSKDPVALETVYLVMFSSLLK